MNEENHARKWRKITEIFRVVGRRKWEALSLGFMKNRERVEPKTQKAPIWSLNSVYPPLLYVLTYIQEIHIFLTPLSGEQKWRDFISWRGPLVIQDPDHLFPASTEETIPEGPLLVGKHFPIIRLFKDEIACCSNTKLTFDMMQLVCFKLF